MHYSKIIALVARDMWQRALCVKDVDRLGRAVKAFKTILLEIFDDQCDSGLSTLNC